MSDAAASMEMPRYQSHKQVWALKIASVGAYSSNEDSHELSFADAGYAPIKVEPKMLARYMPVPGDYYVVYGDGYASISPAKAFEDGYTRI